MKNWLLFLLLIVPFLVQAQEFSFQLYFEDAIGNRDSITLGYDNNATDSLDTEFGEINIIEQPWDSTFEVRLSDQFFFSLYDCGGEVPFVEDLPISYLAKKQILRKPLNVLFPHLPELEYQFPPAIMIKCKHYPLSVTWDASLFNNDNECTRNGLITRNPPSNWDLPPFCMSNHTQAYLDEGSLTIEAVPFYYYTGLDTLLPLFFGFDRDNIHTTLDNISLKENSYIFPNPTTGQIYIATSVASMTEVTLLDLNGNIVQQTKLFIPATETTALDISKFPTGSYFIRLTSNTATSTLPLFLIQP